MNIEKCNYGAWRRSFLDRVGERCNRDFWEKLNDDYEGRAFTRLLVWSHLEGEKGEGAPSEPETARLSHQLLEKTSFSARTASSSDGGA